MLPIQSDIQILQGADWQPVLQWLSEDPVHKLITGVEIGLPTILTVPAHGFTVNARMPVWITNVQGPRALNTDGYTDAEPRWATVIDADTLAVDFDSGSLQAYQRGGVLTTRPAVDLIGWSGKQEIRPDINSDVVLNSLTTENGGITLGADGTITRHITAAQSTAMGPLQGVYILELTDPSGVVTRFAQGTACVAQDFPEVTT